MQTQTLRVPFGALIAAGAATVFASCSGGGSSSSSSSSSAFEVSNVSVQNGSTWQINRAIEVTFTQPVDFSTVNLNTINIAKLGSGPATGEFSFKVQNGVVDTKTIVFQPACPTLGDYSDAGLLPGGISYVLYIPDGDDGAVSVRSTSGTPLADGQTINFVTPASPDPSQIFIDTNAAPPGAIVNDADDGTPLNASASYVELAGDDTNRRYFYGLPGLSFGASTEAGFEAPLNLYSESSTQVSIVLAINQPVGPTSDNIELLRLEYAPCFDDCDCAVDLPADEWVPIASSVTLLENCTAGGAKLRITPSGVLPPNRRVRLVLGQQFADIVGNTNLLDITVGSFCTSVPPDPFADAFKEEFNLGGSVPNSQQDTTTALPAAPADWGNGRLAAGFEFDGQGGPGGVFDWRIRPLPGGSATVFDTSFQLITSADQTATQAVINGIIDVRDFIVDEGATLEFRGPNPVTIKATGTVRINGKVLIRGTSSRGVYTFDSTSIPEPGASGNGGGGKGGAGNYLTSQSTPAGENGFGPFDVPNGGGFGGETGFSASGGIDGRRGAGGGGGSFARYMPLATNAACPDQSVIGLDVENGAPGGVSANGAIYGVGQRPRGGLAGPSPFGDSTTDNDFWGTMIRGTQVVRGELNGPRPGSGGGGGGNSCATSSFPTTPFSPTGDEKGCGGGGGGGALTILAIGDVVFGLKGRIDAGGGTGGGGENTNGINRVGAGSGGGSAGHIIIQSAGDIDFSACSSAAGNLGGIYATGGQGGEGANGAGGANPGGIPTTPNLDMLPPNAYAPSPTCAVTGNTVGVITGCGGDGGPGIIQLHVSALSRIRPPTLPSITLATVMKPNPFGSTPSNVTTPAAWNQLLPIFGSRSVSQSKWIPLGSANVASDSADPSALEFQFGGLTAGGLIETTGSGSSAIVAELPEILSGAVGSNSTPPFIADGRTIVFDAGSLAPADEFYRNSPGLMSRFRLKFSSGETFDIASAAVEGDNLWLTIDSSGTPLDDIAVGTIATVHPRFFAVVTNGVVDSLPGGTSVRIEFQAAPANSLGDPVEALAVGFTSDISVLNSSPSNPTFRFFRFRVTFDIGDVTANPTLPSIDFLRLPYRF